MLFVVSGDHLTLSMGPVVMHRYRSHTAYTQQTLTVDPVGDGGVCSMLGTVEEFVASIA